MKKTPVCAKYNVIFYALRILGKCYLRWNTIETLDAKLNIEFNAAKSKKSGITIVIEHFKPLR